MRRTKDDAEITRRKILDAAMVVFNQYGYASARLEDIAAEAGVTRGAIYHYFEGKPEVYTALLNERFEGVNNLVGSIVSDGGTPKEVLGKLLTKILVFMEENREYRMVQELVLFKTAYLPELEEGMAHKVKSTEATISFIDNLIKEGIQCGEFDKNIDTRAAAIAAVGLFSGVSTLWLLNDKMFSIKKYAESIVDCFLSGIINK
ncbi:MAG: TetR family transcriptional regulator [Clostridia bacterium]|nr:TetR family transcriptional regulator [Clostridia bacterium]